ncbi:hypothetical protein [Pseudoduganella violacea]|uniref:Outer membrane receptor protein involved in Fe transport n=1 Tax=Pseudoduganella violacea TaxID=1715466 RepID=A0A7W5BER0_9BURK|nr:hypothetical protein [Pseudoduganella violacea]MBB3121827.1 outer membrane receptor protein involved in Fe transport [Pseudoduganella violacea]
MPSTVWDTGLRYAFNGRSTLNLFVNNLFGLRYVEDSQADANGINQGVPCNVSLRFTRKF